VIEEANTRCTRARPLPKRDRTEIESREKTTTVAR